MCVSKFVPSKSISLGPLCGDLMSARPTRVGGCCVCPSGFPGADISRGRCYGAFISAGGGGAGGEVSLNDEGSLGCIGVGGLWH